MFAMRWPDRRTCCWRSPARPWGDNNCLDCCQALSRPRQLAAWFWTLSQNIFFVIIESVLDSLRRASNTTGDKSISAQIKSTMKNVFCILPLAGIGLLAGNLYAQTDVPYKILDTTQVMGTGGIDYVHADNVDRRA